MKILQKGFNYSQDGPGNRLVYHLQGCNFACKWCSNADSIPFENPKAKDYCINEVFDEIMRSRMMFFDGGGVTFTGGECTLQHEELSALFELLKEEKISVCIETNGSSPKLRELSENIDYLIIDLKHFDDEQHKKWVGASNRRVKENIEYFFESGRQIHIRIPVINGVNSDPEGFADYFKRFKTENAVFEFLAYHEFGKDKWQGEYQIKNGFVPPETISRFKHIFESNGLKTVST
ncbi:MAG: radical SAM protein [Clostridia bacterium]|nr:radical SAM protein [Clostridia bacterium]